MSPSDQEKLVIVGAREHNLKGVDCELPRNRLVVITGPSGSGKSSLAFDTIYAEGQRRYVESLSAYARQFLQRLPKPKVENIEGLSPSIAIEQKPLGHNPRSTVGTVTETADYLRLLFARLGVPHSPRTGKLLRSHTAQQIVDLICEREEGARITLLAPIARGKIGKLEEELEALRRDGFVRIQLDGQLHDLSDPPALDGARPHDLNVVIDRIVVRPGLITRVTDSVELALKLGQGTVLVDAANTSPPEAFSENWIDWEEGISFPPLEPALFSFNSPLGSCPVCAGLGVNARIDPALLIPDEARSLRQGGIVALGRPRSPALASEVERLVKALRVDPDTPLAKLSQGDREAILHGKVRGKSTVYDGLIPRIQALLDGEDANGPSDEDIQEGALSLSELAQLVSERPCEGCGGRRLRPEALAVRLGGRNIAELSSLPLPQLITALTELPRELSPAQQQIGAPLLQGLVSRLRFLLEVGLHYLTLDRATGTLSGGEGQRIRLATQLGSSLVGVLYVLDEPSVGLHPRDNEQLLGALRRLVDRGNSVLVVEHDRETILAADHVVDMGPGAGEHGGHIVAQGSPRALLEDAASLTAPYLSGKRSLPIPKRRKPAGGDTLRLVGASAHNLNAVSVEVPVGLLTAVTGVSGSGKSTLIVDTLLPAVRAHLQGNSRPRDDLEHIEGLENVDRVVSLDQSPLGRTPRSNPASYTGILGHLRELFAGLPEARARGYRAGRFSFNVKGGRCEACQGEGVLRIGMQFLPDVFVTCEACRGTRYNRETLEVRYRGYSIADVLNLTVEQAAESFSAVPRIHERLQGLQRLGLGYLRLGQPASTLSGGEAQRVKLASELSRPATGRTLYLLDEPTTGLHFSDIELLLVALLGLRDQGNTVLVIEHNLDLIACADWVIDLGPDGGSDGGHVVAVGTPEQVARCKQGHTGRFLAKTLTEDTRPLQASRGRKPGAAEPAAPLAGKKRRRDQPKSRSTRS